MIVLIILTSYREILHYRSLASYVSLLKQSMDWVDKNEMYFSDFFIVTDNCTAGVSRRRIVKFVSCQLLAKVPSIPATQGTI